MSSNSPSTACYCCIWVTQGLVGWGHLSERQHGAESTATGARLPKADVILTDPRFGTKRGGGWPTRDEFTY